METKTSPYGARMPAKDDGRKKERSRKKPSSSLEPCIVSPFESISSNRSVGEPKNKQEAGGRRPIMADVLRENEVVSPIL